MSKLYVAKMIVLHPCDLSEYNNGIRYCSEDIIVKRVPFGYKEVFTNHIFHPKKILEVNYQSNRTSYPYEICDRSTERNLRSGLKQFVLDTNKSFPIREADEIDVKNYIDNFETSSLKRYYDDQEAKNKAEIERKNKDKESKQKAKMLVLDYQSKLKTKN